MESGREMIPQYVVILVFHACTVTHQVLEVGVWCKIEAIGMVCSSNCHCVDLYIYKVLSAMVMLVIVMVANCDGNHTSDD